MKRIELCRSVLVAAAALMSLIVAGCGTTAGGIDSQSRGTPRESMPSQLAGTAHTGFAGYRWQVVTIAREGKASQVPARYDVYLLFTPTGQFGANDPVNYHSGIYRATSSGFTTGRMTTTAAGYVGHDPVTLLAMGAISAFSDGAHATATVAGNRLVVTVGSYSLDCQRDSTT